MKLLLAVDFTDCSLAAVGAVLAQFSPKETQVRLFHAVDWEQQLPASYLFAEGPNAASDLLREKDRIVRDVSALIRDVAHRFEAAGFVTDVEVEPADHARRAIVTAARAWPADLIVMGSHGRSGLNRWLLGSVAEDVMHHAPCSVQVVRPETARAVA